MNVYVHHALSTGSRLRSAGAPPWALWAVLTVGAAAAAGLQTAAGIHSEGVVLRVMSGLALGWLAAGDTSANLRWGLALPHLPLEPRRRALAEALGLALPLMAVNAFGAIAFARALDDISLGGALGSAALAWASVLPIMVGVGLVRHAPARPPLTVAALALLPSAAPLLSLDAGLGVLTALAVPLAFVGLWALPPATGGAHGSPARRWLARGRPHSRYQVARTRRPALEDALAACASTLLGLACAIGVLMLAEAIEPDHTWLWYVVLYVSLLIAGKVWERLGPRANQLAPAYLRDRPLVTATSRPTPELALGDLLPVTSDDVMTGTFLVGTLWFASGITLLRVIPEVSLDVLAPADLGITLGVSALLSAIWTAWRMSRRPPRGPRPSAARPRTSAPAA